MDTRLRLAAALAAFALGGCATLPSGPSILVLPGTGKSFDQFQADNAVCRQFAEVQVGGPGAAAALQQSQVNTAAAGTVLGAAVGAAAGGGRGAGIGAASGLALGSLMGAGFGADASYELQRRYDYAYAQCMYARGNQIPVAGQRWDTSRGYPPPPPGSSGGYVQPPPGSGTPPDAAVPPPGTPPPPGASSG